MIRSDEPTFVDEWNTDDEEQEVYNPTRDAQSIEEKYSSSQLRIVRESRDWQLDYLRVALNGESALVDLKPQYQRRDRWDLKKRSRLIESLLLNIPIPSIFLYEGEYNSYEVIDGKQRLETLRAYLGNEFRLSGTEFWQELDGKLFCELPDVIQRGLLRRSIPLVILLVETKDLNDSGFDIRRLLFNRLNTGGVNLNPQELRNALYSGSLSDMLLELSSDDLFTTVWDIPSHSAAPGSVLTDQDELLSNALYSKMADVEIVLRFFAIRDAIDSGRRGAVRKLLDDFMERERNADERTIEAYKALYRKCQASLYRVFSSSLFRLTKSGKLSRPLYDSLMIASSRIPESKWASGESIRASLDRLLDSEETYSILVGRKNTMASIVERVTLAEDLLRGDFDGE